MSDARGLYVPFMAFNSSLRTVEEMRSPVTFCASQHPVQWWKLAPRCSHAHWYQQLMGFKVFFSFISESSCWVVRLKSHRLSEVVCRSDEMSVVLQRCAELSCLLFNTVKLHRDTSHFRCCPQNTTTRCCTRERERERFFAVMPKMRLLITCM